VPPFHFPKRLSHLPSTERNMSLSEPSRPGVAPPAQQAYPYPPRTTENDISRHPQPMLPPMSSLLPKHERIEQEPHNQYAPRPYPSQQGVNHPLWLSEADPNAPVQHIYHPPLPPTNLRSPQYSADPVLSQNRPPNPPFNPLDQRPPPSQPRQIRKIVQRRYDPPKGDTRTHMVSPSSNPGHSPFQSPHPPSQSKSPFQYQGTMTSPPPPQNQSSGSMSISGLLSDNPR
jgi:hypothetical protein